MRIDKKQEGFFKNPENEIKKEGGIPFPSDEDLTACADLFRVFGDPTRVRILWALSACELCVMDLAEGLGMTVSAVSHQLRVLRDSRLVRAERRGRSVIYSLADDHVRTIIAQGMEHIGE